MCLYSKKWRIPLTSPFLNYININNENLNLNTHNLRDSLRNEENIEDISAINIEEYGIIYIFIR